MSVEQPLFIPAGAEVRQGHVSLKHFALASKEWLISRWNEPPGQAILERCRDSNWDRSVIEQQVGRLYDNFDFRGCPLRGENLSSKDLRRIDFFCADLTGADFTAANLDDAHLSKARIRGARFDWARLTGTFFDDADYDKTTSMIGVDLNGVNFNLATLLYDQARQQQRIVHLQRRHPAFAFFLRVSSDYGRSLVLWTFWVTVVVMVFGLVYASVPGIIKPQSLLDALYFSAVTFTTVGYGDVVPLGGGRIVAVIEMFLGLIMAGLLVAIITRRLFGD